MSKPNVHFVLDEAAALGPMDSIDDAVGMGRGYGIRLQFYFQSLGQARRCFPEGQEQTLLGNCTQVYFGVNDPQTAELVSGRLGESTVVVDSGGGSRGRSWGASYGPSPGTNTGGNAGGSWNWQQQARRLLKPEEVIALPPRVAITFTPGVRPVLTWLSRYYEADLTRPGRFFAAAWRLLKAAATSAVMVAIAAMLIRSALTERSGPAPQPHRFAPGPQQRPVPRYLHP